MQIGGSDQRFLRRKTRPEMPTGAPVRVVDLFSGCGGLTLGVAEACRDHGRGIEIALAMEIGNKIRDVYDKNFSSTLKHNRGNVLSRFDGRLGATPTHAERTTAKEVGAVDILVGGPPCQGHSSLNNHTRWNDPKNELYLVMVRAAELLNPRCLMIENVPGVAKDGSGVLDRAKRRLSDIGYSVTDRAMRLLDLGVPQSRVRHVLLASRIGQVSLSDIADRNKTTPERDLKWAIEDLRNATRRGLDKPSVLSDENHRRAKFLHANKRYDLPNWLRPACHRDSPGHTYTAMYGRLSWTKPAHTITTGFSSPGQGRYLHPTQIRTITPHEAARIQFFPDWFDFGPVIQARKLLSACIGNAVPSKLAFVMATEMLFVDHRQSSQPSSGVVGEAGPVRSVA